MKVSVLGSGGWGTALAMLLRDNGHQVSLWSRRQEQTDLLQKERNNPKLPGVRLPKDLKYTSDLTCVRDQEVVVIATPSYAVRETARKIRDLLAPGTILVSTSKGIEKETFLRMSQVIEEETGGKVPVAALSGPSHAEEVARRLPTACVSASTDRHAAELIQDLFMNERFRVYCSPDIIGVELCAALKNVIALCAGCCDGVGYGDNTKAMLMTRGLTEMARLGEAMGGKKETFAGLAGMGDLIVTCTSMHSRNRRAGILIGRGETALAAMDVVGAVVEGYYAAAVAKALAEKAGVEMPIVRAACQVLYEQRSVDAVMRELMTRKKNYEVEPSWI